MKTSNNGLELIRKHEGLRLTAYKCPAGVWTIGYGHTGGVRPGDIVTKDEAEKMLLVDVGASERAVNAMVAVPVSQNQFDALVSFVFNLGSRALERSTLLRLLNRGDESGAAEQFGKWVYSGTTVLPGLVKRRAEERALFERGEA